MRISLSPMDYYFYRRRLYTIQYAFEYDGLLDVEAFHRALKKVEEAMPVITARIAIQSRSEIALDAASGRRVPVQVLEDSGAALFDPIVNAPGEPLVKIRITTALGRTRVGFSFSHLLGDGFSFFLFLNALSSFARGAEHVPVSNRRELLFGPSTTRSAPVTGERLFRETGYLTARPPSPHSTRLEELRLSPGELAAIKAEAARENSDVTTNDALMAYLLQRFYQSIPLTSDGLLIVRCPVDYRRIYPNVPNRYFGNAVKDAVASFDPDRIPRLTLGEIASQVRAAIRSVNEASIYASLVCMNDLRLERGIDFFEELGCPGLLVSNLSKLPFESVDFGLGKPTAVLHASLNPRLAVILPDRDGIRIKACLPVP